LKASLIHQFAKFILFIGQSNITRHIHSGPFYEIYPNFSVKKAYTEK